MSPAIPVTTDLLSTAAREVGSTLRSAMWPVARLLPLPEPVPGPSRRPVVLVHGFLGHPGMMRPIARRLLQEGWSEIAFVQYYSVNPSIEGIAARIALAVEALGGGRRVDLVGHSLGAFAARAWVKCLGGASHVGGLVSIGGPHAGTSLYRLAPPALRGALDPRGLWVGRLAHGPEPVPTTVIRARFDHQVFPPRRAGIDGVREVVLGGYGHNGLLWSPAAHDAVVEALAGEEAVAASAA